MSLAAALGLIGLWLSLPAAPSRPGPPAVEDWPQWRGPARDGHGTAPRGPARAWRTLSRSWRTQVGEGHASPIVQGSQVFVFAREGDDEILRALDLETGRARWRRAYPAPYEMYPGAAAHGKGPKSTPTISGDRVFTLGIGGILTCFDAATGRIVWQRTFDGRFPKASPPFGTSMSPLAERGVVIVHVGGHEGGALIALDARTGAARWEWIGEGPSYSSPVLWRQGDRLQVVAQVHRKVIGLDFESGQLLWSLPFVTPCDQNVVTPVVAGDLLILSSLDKGTMGVRLGAGGGSFTPETAWHSKEVSMYMSTPVVASGRLIGLSHRRRGQYFALDPKDGSILWKSAGGEAENSAFVVQGETLLILENDAELVVLSAAARSFEPLARHTVASTETWAHPVPAAGGVLIRDETSLALMRAD